MATLLYDTWVGSIQQLFWPEMMLQSHNDINVSTFKMEICFINMLHSSTSLFLLILAYSGTKIHEYLSKVCMFDYSG